MKVTCTLPEVKNQKALRNRPPMPLEEFSSTPPVETPAKQRLEWMKSHFSRHLGPILRRFFAVTRWASTVPLNMV